MLRFVKRCATCKVDIFQLALVGFAVGTIGIGVSIVGIGVGVFVATVGTDVGKALGDCVGLVVR